MLLDPSGTPVPAVVTYSALTKTARLTPEAELNPSTTYTVQIKGGATGVTGPTGALAANFSWKFTTVARPGGGPPLTVTNVLTPNGASGVNARSTKVIVFFSNEMDPATINEGTIRLQGKGIGPAGSVPYRVTYGEETHTATIETIGLIPGTTYTVTIKGGADTAGAAKGVKDQKGNALGADVTKSFTTLPRSQERDSRPVRCRGESARISNAVATARLFRCSGRLFSKIHRKSLDLSDLRPANRIASLTP